MWNREGVPVGKGISFFDGEDRRQNIFLSGDRERKVEEGTKRKEEANNGKKHVYDQQTRTTTTTMTTTTTIIITKIITKTHEIHDIKRKSKGYSEEWENKKEGKKALKWAWQLIKVIFYSVFRTEQPTNKKKINKGRMKYWE